MLIHRYFLCFTLGSLVNDFGSSFHQFTRLEIILGRGLHGSLHSEINKITILHKNVAFKTTVTYTKEVIETW